MPDSLSLSELLSRVAKVLKNEFTESHWIVAEVMELHVNRSGHCYLELIEKSTENDSLLARSRGTIWASRYSMLRPYFEASTGTTLKSGIKLLFKASIEFHTQFGFSLNITDIDPDYTLGDLARKKQEVIKKLREDGVMEMNREIPFPMVPQRIAVISSDTAAGYGDFIDSIQGNSQGFYLETSLFPAVMQGEDAPGSITKALDRVFESPGEFDCVVLIRGGGSKADLECYNSYDLAYYITQFPLPVLTGIGHERDESVVDLVAARSLKTPTAVAEFLIDQLLAFEFHLSALYDKLSVSVRQIVQNQVSRLERYGHDLDHFASGLLQRKIETLRRTRERLELASRVFLERKKDQHSMLEKQIELVDPKNVLKRGYSIALVKGKPMLDASKIKEGDTLVTKLYKGELISKIEKTKP